MFFDPEQPTTFRQRSLSHLRNSAAFLIELIERTADFAKAEVCATLLPAVIAHIAKSAMYAPPAAVAPLYERRKNKAPVTDRRGVCIRLQGEDFEDIDDLTAQVAALLDTLGVSPGECDLLLDLRAVGVNEGNTLLAAVPVLVRSVPQLERWRSLVLAATAFPEDLMGLAPSSISLITRLEWTVWRTLIGRSRVRRLPAFGDYAIAHPQPSEVDPRIMRPSASIRYTTDDAWLILKGRNLRDYGYAEFYDVCRELIRRPEYSGAGFSWGDWYIDECANQRVGTGNLTTWRKVGTSHHLAVVTRQIASLA